MRELHSLISLTFQIGSISWQTPSWSIFPNSRPTFRILHYQYDFESPIACLGRDSTDFQRKQPFLDHRWALELVGPKRINTLIIWQTQSLCSHWFFLGQDFAVRTVTMETVQSVYFCLGAKPANSTFATKTARKKV